MESSRNRIASVESATMHSRRFWIVMIFAGWSFDFLFWKQAPGINFAIFVSLCLVAGIALLGSEGMWPARKSLLLLPPIGFFAVMTFVRMEPMTMFVAVCAVLGLMAVLVVTYLGGNWPRYSLVDYAIRFFRLYASMFIRGMFFIQETRRRKVAESGGEDSGAIWKRFWPAVRGVLIAIPIVAVFAALLASADLVFSQRLEDLADIFSLGSLPEYIFRGTYILILAYFLGGIILHAANESRDEEPQWVFKPFLGFTEAAIILGSIMVLFAGFVVIQFQYFFGGEKNIDVAGYVGYTYADYARRGFGELVAVAVCSLLLLMALSAFSRRDDRRQRMFFTSLGVAVVGLVLVMLVSAFQRILLYESAYGFSRLRTYTHVFLIWLGFLLVAIIILEIFQRQRMFAFAAVLAAAGFVATLGVMNVDGFIVSQNVQRALNGKELDIVYLESLSDDAVPTIADEYRSAPDPSALHTDLGLVLSNFANDEKFKKERSWQSFNLAHKRAVDAIDELQG